jgi:hypothetical protein
MQGVLDLDLDLSHQKNLKLAGGKLELHAPVFVVFESEERNLLFQHLSKEDSEYTVR